MSAKEKQKAEKLHQSAASLGRRIQELAGVQGLHDAITEHVLTIASLRAANKKLRAELAATRRDADERLESWGRSSHSAFVWREAHRQLADALKAKP